MPDAILELISLWEKMDGCTDCFREGEKLHSCVGTGRLNPLIMLINHHPFVHGAHKDRDKIIGVANVLQYEAMLHSIGITWEQTWCTSCVKCMGRRGPGVPKTCKKYLDTEIQLVNPKLIVCLGEVSFHALVDDTKGLIEWTPNKEYNLNGRKVVTMVSPETISQNPRYERYWMNAAKLVKTYMKQPQLDWWD